MAYRKKTQEVKEETVVTPDVVSSEEVETQVINTNEKAKKVIKENVAGETVIVAYNGVHSQVFDVPCKGQVKRVVIKGNNADLIGKPKGELYAGGYGLTQVEKEAWDWISKTYKNWPPIKNGLMFASTSAKVADAAQERADLRNGYEPLERQCIRGVEEKGTT